MAINKKLIHFKNKTKFEEELAKNNINDASICFIKDTQQIWTHGQLYSCNVDINSLEDVVRVDEEGYINKDKLIIGEMPSWVLELLDSSEEDLVDTNSLCTRSSYEDEYLKRFTESIVKDGYNSERALEYRINDHLITTNIKETGGHGTTQYVQTMPMITVDGKLEVDEEDLSRVSYTVNAQVSGAIQQMCIGAPDGIGHTSGVSTYSDAVSLVSMVSYEDEQTGEWIEKGTDLTVTTDGVFVNGTPLALGIIPITYSELVTLRDNGTLSPGTMYRITDYVCTTTLPDTASANHPFDIVVTAISNNALSEEASVVLHEGDTYFANSNLSAWKVWYTLDNDKNRFNWACNTVTALCKSHGSRFPEELLNTEIILTPYEYEDYIERDKVLYVYDLSSGSQVYFTDDGRIYDEASIQVGSYTIKVGKGVIYRMIDEKNNDLPYDFKNILFIENNYSYEVNELGKAISLSNPLEISYTLLADTDEEYNGKDDAIVEINQSDETPDKAGQDVWVLYKTDLGGYQEEGVDYADMFVFVDKYDYNGQTWDRWRKAEFDGNTWHWVTHEGSSVCILTEQLLDVTGNNHIYRYTFNLEEFLGDLSQADASIVAKDSESEKGIRNNYMQSCYIDYNGIGTSEYSLPINVFKITSTDWFNIYGNHFSGLYTYNTFEGGQFAANRFDPVCCENTFADLAIGTFGSYFCGNTLRFSNLISCGMYNMANTLGGTSLTLGNYVRDCDVNGWSLTVAANTGGCAISGSNAIINTIDGSDERKIIEIPDSEYTLKVAQNSRGEIKIYNEADLIA